MKVVMFASVFVKSCLVTSRERIVMLKDIVQNQSDEGQNPGSCFSFDLTHYKADLKQNDAFQLSWARLRARSSSVFAIRTVILSK